MIILQFLCIYIKIITCINTLQLNAKNRFLIVLFNHLTYCFPMNIHSTIYINTHDSLQ